MGKHKGRQSDVSVKWTCKKCFVRQPYFPIRHGAWGLLKVTRLTAFEHLFSLVS